MPGRPLVQGFFDEATNTVSYVVSDPATKVGAIVDSVLDYDPAAGRTDTAAGNPVKGSACRARSDLFIRRPDFFVRPCYYGALRATCGAGQLQEGPRG